MIDTYYDMVKCNNNKIETKLVIKGNPCKTLNYEH